MKLQFSKASLKQLKKLSKLDRERILVKLEFFSKQKNPLDFAEPLIHSGFGQYRFRIGNFRVIFDYEKDLILILKIGHRRDIYKK